jgi:predicted nuclease of restriction endonuclease-like (RecB) superfamily
MLTNKIDSNINIFLDLKTKIINAQNQSLKYLNSQMLGVYFEIGKVISENLKNGNWGDKVVDEMEKYFVQEFPGIKSFNRRNLYHMVSYFELCNQNSIVLTLSTQLSWSHLVAIFVGNSNIESSTFYIKHAIKNNYTVRQLRDSIKFNDFAKYTLSQNNYEKLLPAVFDSDIHIISDETNLDFLVLSRKHKEREIEDGIVDNIVKFLSRMGGTFSFVGRQYPINFETEEYAIDLLFYHLELRCFVVIELKAEKFKPDHIGQLALYIGAVNRKLKKPIDNPTIGIIICSEKDRNTVDYMLDVINAPVGVSTYSYTELPKDIAKFLPSDEDFELTLN